MKLVSLYIENFGGLSAYSLNFEETLTVINRPNGFGKTTLAEFIRAMLYGFPRKSKTLDKSKRQKYAPWNGGVYGGNLVFVHEGQRYRLERTFGATPKGDTFTLIDLSTNRKTTTFSEEIGMELFGLDSDSFERSTYLPQMREEGPLATDAIQAKLNDLVEDSGDVGSFDKAMAALRGKRSMLIPYRGTGGAMAEADGEISRLQQQLEQAQLASEQLEAAQEEVTRKEASLEQTKLSLSQTRQELTAASEAAVAAAQQRQYEQLCIQHRQAEDETVRFREAYPMGLPEEQDLRSAELTADRLAVLAEQTITGQSDLQAQSFLQEHPQVEANLPSQKEMETYRKKCENYTILQETLYDLQLRAAEMMQLKAAQKGKSGAVPAVLLILGVVAVVCGAVLLFLRQYLYGGISLGAGVAVFLVGRFLRANAAAQRRQEEDSAASQQKIAAVQESCTQCREEIQQFLAAYYGAVEPQQFLAYLTRLEHDAQRCIQARQQVQQWQLRREQHEAQIKECRETLQAFLGRFGLMMESDIRTQLRQLREDGRDARVAEEAKNRLMQQLETFREEHAAALAAQPPRMMDVQRLKEKEAELQNSLMLLTSDILRQQQKTQNLREQSEQIPELREQLQLWLGKKSETRENARILDDTMEFLQRAKDSLATAYLGTIRERFAYYMTQLEGVCGEKYFIGPDFEVQLERLGQARNLAYFSAGETDLVKLCMRLALVDALFKGQETFVILDDPFVNLDDVHTAQALKLLCAFSADHQILYLTCHTSRMV